MVNIYDSQALYQQGQQEEAEYQQWLLQQAWEALQSVPSYFERFADGREQFPENNISLVELP